MLPEPQRIQAIIKYARQGQCGIPVAALCLQQAEVGWGIGASGRYLDKCDNLSAELLQGQLVATPIPCVPDGTVHIASWKSHLMTPGPVHKAVGIVPTTAG